MAKRAKVYAVDALTRFRPALIKFVDECSAALVSAEADSGRVVMRIRGERYPYWKKQIRVRQDELVRAKSELAMKKVMRDADDARSDVDQVKAVERAQRRVAEAEEKTRLCKEWARKLEKEQNNFRGQVGALRRILESDMPIAIAELDRMVAALEDYLKTGGPRPAGKPKPDSTSPTGETPTPPDPTTGNAP